METTIFVQLCIKTCDFVQSFEYFIYICTHEDKTDYSTTAIHSFVLGLCWGWDCRFAASIFTSYATDYFVSPAGNDSNSGLKEDKPFATLGKVISLQPWWQGAEDNAVFYSLLESCDVVQLNPLDWLSDVLAKLKDNMDEDEITQLMPYQYKKSRVILGIFCLITGRPKLKVTISVTQCYFCGLRVCLSPVSAPAVGSRADNLLTNISR